jgi:hypothetical protein
VFVKWYRVVYREELLSGTFDFLFSLLACAVKWYLAVVGFVDRAHPVCPCRTMIVKVLYAVAPVNVATVIMIELKDFYQDRIFLSKFFLISPEFTEFQNCALIIIKALACIERAIYDNSNLYMPHRQTL